MSRAGHEIKELLASEVQSAEESYRTHSEQYRDAVNKSNADDPEAQKSIYGAARELRIARKPYRRATRTLSGFAASA